MKKPSAFVRVVVEAEGKRHPLRYVPFYAASKRARSDATQSAYILLGDVFSYHFQPNNRERPFRAMVELDSSRSASVENLSDEDIALLEQMIEWTDKAWFRAWVADVLMTRTGKVFPLAQQAAEHYLEQSRELIRAGKT